MPHHPILIYPDPRLREPAAAVTAFDAALLTLATDLVDTLRHAGALGITAPHIGVPLRVVAIQLGEPDGKPDGKPDTVQIYVNPEVIRTSTETARNEEGSVSMPGVTDTLERPARITVRYQDLQGQTHTEDADGLLAVCHLHEIDQLNGIFWIDRLSRLKRDRLLTRWQKRRPA